MAIYKIKRFSTIGQREFTRAEKEAFLELYKKTKGLKQLPKGVSPNRLCQFAVDLKKMSLGNAKAFNRENAKTLFQNAGMSKMANQVDKMIDKYTNKRALVRLARLKNRKGNEVDPKAIQPIYNKSLSLLRKGAKIREEAIEGFDNLHKTNKPDPKAIKYLINYAKKNDIDVIRSSNHPDFSSKYDSFVETMPDMSKTIKGSGGKNYIGKVTQNTGALESDLAHELGHIKVFKTKVGKKIKQLRGLSNKTPQLFNRQSRGKAFLDDRSLVFQNVADNVLNVSNENAASIFARPLMKMSKSRQEMGRENLQHALTNYMGVIPNNAGNDSIHLLKWI